MAVGLLAGCGGAEEMDATVSPEEQGQVEQGVTHWECVNDCDSKWFYCVYGGGGTPRPTCDSYKAFCISQCPP
ncbi:hypothetical protein D7X32_12350 [Corallococcus carmarthensis]|uniref:Uncharacterized protein n=2 Tax=Corallococcus carmarthensis TaxID=2316728 RepID=A0A3A8KIP0_9BACT|nr:hypothetical protein D7X32_12350 [Corallococcus carmarthensis]